MAFNAPFFPRQVIGLLAAAGTDPEAVVARGDMHKDSFDGAADHIFERRRIHEQLPVVLVSSKVKRYLIGMATISGERGRRQEQRNKHSSIPERSR